MRTGNIPYDISYGYDAVGNRTSKSVLGGATTNYTYGDNNQCLSAGSTTFGYDNNGNLTSKTTGGQTTTYAWGFENELLSIAYPGGATNSFTTNRLGNRVSKTDSLGASASLYDGAQVLADSRADYTWGGATGLISERAGSASRWYHGDETGGTRGLTDGAQTATDSLDYDSWGLAVRTTGTSVTPFRHKGGLGYRTDPDSGLLLLGARYYDPALGRFISRDPMGYAAGDPNLYRYAANNPVNASDPSGKWLDTLLDVLGLVLDIKDFVEEPTWSGAGNILVGAATMFLPGVVNPRTMVRIAGWGGWVKKLQDARFACPLSFARGTPVWMADGTKKPIEQVRKGEYVRSADEWTGQERDGRVSCTFQRESDTLLTIRTADGKKIETTPTHPFFVEGRGFVAAKRLARSDLLTDREGWAAAVVSVTERKGRFPVYNLEVAGAGTYYAGEAGWWVHNACDRRFHHIFPRQFQNWFESHGIDNIHKYTAEMSKRMHDYLHHPPGHPPPGGGWWNDEWEQFINSNHQANGDEIWEQADRMMRMVGIKPDDLVDYPR